jgi:hypothetical protein
MTRLAILALLIASPAFAEERCKDNGRDEIIAGLAKGYGETQIVEALDPAVGVIVELYANAKSGTWTLLSTFTDGRTCLIGSGTGVTIAKQGEPL